MHSTMSNPSGQPKSTESPLDRASAGSRLIVLMFTDLVASSAAKIELGDVDYAEKLANHTTASFGTSSPNSQGLRRTTTPATASSRRLPR